MAKAYLTYDEYTKYGGALSEDAFLPLEFQARKRIDYWTDSRVAAMAEVPEAVKLCMMQLIAAYGKFGVEAQVNNPVITSFNTDGYSESYGSAEGQLAAVKKSMDATIREMLYGELDDRGVLLLYRGLDV